MGRAPLRAGDGLRHRSGAGACGPAPRVKTLAAYMAAYNPTCSLYACDADLDTSSAAASGASKTACASTCTWVPNKHKKAGTGLIAVRMRTKKSDGAGGLVAVRMRTREL